MFGYVVVFAATVAISAKLEQPAPLHRSILNPVSFAEASVHDRSICELDRVVAARFDGGLGGVGVGTDVVAVAVLE